MQHRIVILMKEIVVCGILGIGTFCQKLIVCSGPSCGKYLAVEKMKSLSFASHCLEHE